MHGYSGHTYKFIREDGEWVYVQVHVRADGGFKVNTSLLGRLERLADHVNADPRERHRC